MSLQATGLRHVAQCYYAVRTNLNDTLCPRPGARDRTGSLVAKLPAASQVLFTLPITDVDVLIRRNQHKESRTLMPSSFMVAGWDPQLAPQPLWPPLCPPAFSYGHLCHRHAPFVSCLLCHHCGPVCLPLLLQLPPAAVVRNSQRLMISARWVYGTHMAVPCDFLWVRTRMYFVAN